MRTKARNRCYPLYRKGKRKKIYSPALPTFGDRTPVYVVMVILLAVVVAGF
jgi:hypothetical protein